jgi:hypothetical protein
MDYRIVSAKEGPTRNKREILLDPGLYDTVVAREMS